MRITFEEAKERTLQFIRFRKRDYQLTFRSVAGQGVLKDLGKFCRANESCFQDDPRAHAVLEGRREVFLRIQKHLNLPEEQLYAILGGVILQPSEDDR